MYKTTFELEQEIMQLKRDNLELSKALYNMQATVFSTRQSKILTVEEQKAVEQLINFYNYAMSRSGCTKGSIDPIELYSIANKYQLKVK